MEHVTWKEISFVLKLRLKLYNLPLFKCFVKQHDPSGQIKNSSSHSSAGRIGPPDSQVWPAGRMFDPCEVEERLKCDVKVLTSLKFCVFVHHSVLDDCGFQV